MSKQIVVATAVVATTLAALGVIGARIYKMHALTKRMNWCSDLEGNIQENNSGMHIDYDENEAPDIESLLIKKIYVPEEQYLILTVRINGAVITVSCEFDKKVRNTFLQIVLSMILHELKELGATTPIPIDKVMRKALERNLQEIVPKE